jgi:hypothetical protein
VEIEQAGSTIMVNVDHQRQIWQAAKSEKHILFPESVLPGPAIDVEGSAWYEQPVAHHC